MKKAKQRQEVVASNLTIAVVPLVSNIRFAIRKPSHTARMFTGKYSALLLVQTAVRTQDILLGHIYALVIVGRLTKLAHVQGTPVAPYAQCYGRSEREDKRAATTNSQAKKNRAIALLLFEFLRRLKWDSPSAPRTLSLRPRWATKRFLCRPSVTLST